MSAAIVAAAVRRKTLLHGSARRLVAIDAQRKAALQGGVGLRFFLKIGASEARQPEGRRRREAVGKSE